jgi:hypothetical protein
MKNTLRLLLLVPLVLLASGCVSNQTATKAPSADLSKLKTFYVVKLEMDERGVNQFITDQLSSMGFTASTGPSASSPTPVDALVTYQDKWMWDMTMYMIQLEVQLRQPANNIVLATGASMRSSLKRKPAEEMVKEVLSRIFAQ